MAATWPVAPTPTEGKVLRNKEGEIVSVNGIFNYQSDSVVRSLVANGKICCKRDGSGSDGELLGVNWAPVEVTVLSGRTSTEAPTLDKHGFELRQSATAMSYDTFYDEDKILKTYYPECADLVKKMTGAKSVVAFDHNIRSAAGKQSSKQIQGGSAVQAPASLVHGDYTLTSAPRRLEQLAQKPKANDTLGKVMGGAAVLSKDDLALAQRGRFAFVNVWRNIRDEPVEAFPLACVDASTADSEDLCVFEIHYADRVGENYFSAHSPRHQWYYYPRMVRDEAMLIKQWDSAVGSLSTGKGEKATDGRLPFAIHSAFVDPSCPAGRDRESIEVRCVCVFAEEGAAAEEPAAKRPRT